ncbi:hypothetical protein O3M35_005656 [Rhynocoris fuscipes]|uniref:Cytochrome c oxidase subunit 5B, mitochondrial n=1 Tax=Rhynocoris fuscipes TaxID=488301 RepID=A0AAW1DK94_9HEMI
MSVAFMRNINHIAKRRIFTSATKLKNLMPDPVEHATGLEKKELLAKLSGIENPFDMRVFKRGPGTKDCPNQIPSAFNSRLLGCICHVEATTIRWMWLYHGYPKRCACGYWFELVYKQPV